MSGLKWSASHAFYAELFHSTLCVWSTFTQQQIWFHSQTTAQLSRSLGMRLQLKYNIWTEEATSFHSYLTLSPSPLLPGLPWCPDTRWFPFCSLRSPSSALCHVSRHLGGWEWAEFCLEICPPHSQLCRGSLLETISQTQPALWTLCLGELSQGSSCSPKVFKNNKTRLIWEVYKKL